MLSTNALAAKTLARDATAGLVVFLVALPLCLGVATASNAPLLSGILAGIVGGILVGVLSGSHTSVSGPSAGSTAVVAAHIAALGFPSFLTAVVVAGLIQSILGIARAGFLAAFIPSSVIKGLLASIGVILILKQLPHLVGHHADPHGDMAFLQIDNANTFSAFGHMIYDMRSGAAVIGILSVILLVFWPKLGLLRRFGPPASFAVVMLGIALSEMFQQIGGTWRLSPGNFVNVPVPDNIGDLLNYLQWPDFSQLWKSSTFSAALAIAAVTSLETLLNIEAVDKIDPQQRNSPPSRELLAQGIGNVVVGLMGGIPITSVIVRSSVNINAGAQTKLSTIAHGCLLLVSVAAFPEWLNRIPLSCLAAILLVTGVKLASPQLFRQMWQEGRYQFIPFALTVVAVVLTDLLTGVLIGLTVSIGFILNSNFRRPIRRFVEKHLGGTVLRIELANQVSFLNRAALQHVLASVPNNWHVLLDARGTDYIDPDVQDLIRDYSKITAPAHDVRVSMVGFRSKYLIQDRIEYVDYSTRELQQAATPADVLQMLREGHRRFRSGQRLTRDLARLVNATASDQHPLAVVVSCMDSRVPSELIFDLGLGDIMSIRVAGNVMSAEILGSLEYACAVAGAKLILVMGHTRCGAVAAALAAIREPNASTQGECEHIDVIVRTIQQSIDPRAVELTKALSHAEQLAFADSVARKNIYLAAKVIRNRSKTLDRLCRSGSTAIVAALYDVASGDIEFFPNSGVSMNEGDDSRSGSYAV